MGELRESEAFLSKDCQRSMEPAQPLAHTASTQLLLWPALESRRQKAVSTTSKGYCGCSKYCSGVWDGPATCIKACRNPPGDVTSEQH